MPFFVNAKSTVALTVFMLFMAAFGASTPAQAQTEGDGSQFGDWTIVCADGAEDIRNCWLGQVLQRQEDGQFLAEIRLRLANEGSENRYLMVLHTPTGILLTERAAYRVADVGDSDAPLLWHNCTERRCIALRSLQQDEVERLRGGLRMVVGYQRVQEAQPTVFEVSLMGVTAGLAALQAQE